VTAQGGIEATLDATAVAARVLARFPYPIARRLDLAEAARKSDQPVRAFNQLLNAAEALVQLVGSVLVLDACTRADTDERRAELRRMLGGAKGTSNIDNPGLGTWSHYIKVQLPEPGGFFGAATDTSSLDIPRLLCAVEPLVKARNDVRHADGNPSEEEARKANPDLRTRLLKACAVLDFLTDFRLMVVVHTRRSGGLEHCVLTLLGKTLVLEPRWLRFDASIHARDVLLVHPASNAYVRLDPLYRGTEHLDSEGVLWRYAGVERQAGPLATYHSVDGPARFLEALTHGVKSIRMTQYLARLAEGEYPSPRGTLMATERDRDDLAWEAVAAPRIASLLGLTDVTELRTHGSALVFSGRTTGQPPAAKSVVSPRVELPDPPARVVVKTTASRTNDVVQRDALRTEYDLLHRIDDEHVVRAWDLVEHEDGSLYLVVDHVPGRTLSEHVGREIDEGRRAGLPEDQIEPLARQIAAGLHAIHLVGAHRDLKPANTVVNPSDPKVTLIDLGIGRRLDDVTTRTSAVGTPGFAPPESLNPNEQEEPRLGDIYSFGAVLHFMITGEAPVVDSARNIIVSSLRASRRWRILIKWCGRSDPDERPQSVQAILEFLDGSAAPDEITDGVEYDTAIERFWHEGVVQVAMLAAVGALLAGVVRPGFLVVPAILFSFWLARRIKAAADAATERRLWSGVLDHIVFVLTAVVLLAEVLLKVGLMFGIPLVVIIWFASSAWLGSVLPDEGTHNIVIALASVAVLAGFYALHRRFLRRAGELDQRPK